MHKNNNNYPRNIEIMDILLKNCCFHGNNDSLATKKVYDYSVYGWPCGYYSYIIQV